MRIHHFFIYILLMSITHAIAADDFVSARQQMIEDIQTTVTYTSYETKRQKLSEDVMRAMAEVPRHEFVPQALRQYAYLNRPLPIGHKQTISQPYIVALMTDLATVDSSSVVLEVGTGSGYQAAVLGKLVGHVYTIEIIEALGRRAGRTLDRLGYDNITVKIDDGYHGWPEHAPFDAILVTAAPERIPQPLLDQLKIGGRLVIPVGKANAVQHLLLVKRLSKNNFEETKILPVGFVPLLRDH